MTEHSSPTALKRYLTILRRHRHPVRFTIARLLVSTGLCRLLTIPQRGYRIRFHPANLPTNLWIDPSYREEALSFFQAYLKPGDRVIDVGANVGDTVLTSALKVGKNGHVTGVEAHPRTFKFLTDNIAMNKAANVSLIHSAVGDAQGTVQFSDSRYDDMNHVNGGTLLVPVNTLDELIPPAEPLALLKVDVEGYELPVFKGAQETLECSRCVYFEVGDRMCRHFGYTPAELLSEVMRHGFHLLIHAEGQRLLRLRDEQPFEPYINMVAVKDPAELVQRTNWQIDGC